MTLFASPDALLAAIGTELDTSDWMLIDQQRIDAFADATGDHQWIHVDPARAAVGPFGAPVAHGYLTLSLVALLLPQIIGVERTELFINAGSDRIRFLQPVVVGSRLRANGTLVGAEASGPGIRATIRVTMEIEGVEKPAMIADILTTFVPE